AMGMPPASGATGPVYRTPTKVSNTVLGKGKGKGKAVTYHSPSPAPLFPHVLESSTGPLYYRDSYNKITGPILPALSPLGQMSPASANTSSSSIFGPIPSFEDVKPQKIAPILRLQRPAQQRVRGVGGIKVEKVRSHIGISTASATAHKHFAKKAYVQHLFSKFQDPLGPGIKSLEVSRLSFWCWCCHGTFAAHIEDEHMAACLIPAPGEKEIIDLTGEDDAVDLTNDEDNCEFTSQLFASF
ncbi:hypothetical protein FRB97_000917, partial [Tulasnella sp. 331]